jgi:uncharacterized membrane protein
MEQKANATAPRTHEWRGPSDSTSVGFHLFDFFTDSAAETRLSVGSVGDWALAKDGISSAGHLRRETMAFAIAIHALAAVIWVGGMFFAYMVLRPSAGPLEAPVRLQLWERVFSRFFPWVWTSVAILLASGLGMIFWGYGGFAAMGAYVHVMLGIGLLMIAIYAHLYFVPWRRLRRAV